MKTYFSEIDFSSFADEYAVSVDPNILSGRESAANGLRLLNDNGLKEHMCSLGLHPHWLRAHLTSVYHPLPEANGGFVDYIRMGYGKSKAQIDDLARLYGLTKNSKKGFAKYDMSFHYITQMQITLNDYYWGTALHLDKAGWLERNMFVRNIEENRQLFLKVIDNLSILQDEGYFLFLLDNSGVFYFDDAIDDAEEYVNKIICKTGKKEHFSIRLDKPLDKDSMYNNEERILPYLKNQFEKLLPLYKIIAYTQ